MRAFVASALIGATFLLSACDTPGGGPLGIVLFDKNHNVSGAGSLFAADEQTCVSASFLLSTFAGKIEQGEKPACSRLRARIQNALPVEDIFHSDPLHPGEMQRRRNEAIATLIAASNDKCGAYVQYLQQYQGNVKASTGILSQATAILATVSSGGTAQGFAAASGISTGVGTSLHQAHFQNQTVAMLTKAFDGRRSEMLHNMDGLMQCSITQYPFARAFADVQNYHAACSIVIGLEEAQEAVEEKNSPSLDSFTKLLEKLPALQEAMDNAKGKKKDGNEQQGQGEGQGRGARSAGWRGPEPGH